MRAWSLLALGYLASCGGVSTPDRVVLGTSDVSDTPRFETPAAAPDDLGNVSFGLLINDERGDRDVLPLTENALLNEAASLHAEDMVENDYLSHTGLDGSTAGDRAEAVGYEWTFIAENIAQGFDTETAVVDAWMGSAPHESNMLDPRAVDFGLGREDDTWVLMLGAQ